MTIINTTFVIAHPVENDVLDWIHTKYLKSARLPDKSLYPHMVALVDNAPHPDDAPGGGAPSRRDTPSVAYAVHITFPDNDAARIWDDKFGSRLRQIAQQRWGEMALSFTTYLKVLEW